MVEVNGRLMSRSSRVKALRRAIAKRRLTLERSMAHRPEPWPRDLERWASMAADIAKLENTLALVLAGGDPPFGERTGAMTGELPDAIR